MNRLQSLLAAAAFAGAGLALNPASAQETSPETDGVEQQAPLTEQQILEQLDADALKSVQILAANVCTADNKTMSIAMTFNVAVNVPEDSTDFDADVTGIMDQVVQTSSSTLGAMLSFYAAATPSYQITPDNLMRYAVFPTLQAANDVDGARVATINGNTAAVIPALSNRPCGEGSSITPPPAPPTTI